ncbi:hypothetical protein [Tychonema sp. LEGE 07203]|uniref:hypothetical protein n=1 Tax=Tychonema sp. LEGE 07203 TaxID=1828671 RepID=UPI001882F201|nr:hypothetical protein [Tychonema sp. LEGE 07203]MBE9096220.1 hypothetical protein [Tychonema sp. LEGE 07203]
MGIVLSCRKISVKNAVSHSKQLQGSIDRNGTPDPSRTLIALDRTNCRRTETGLTRQASGITHRMLVAQPDL